MLRRINPVLPELMFGIIAYGCAVWLAGVWFVEDKPSFTVGLLFGLGLAAGIAVNMAVVILDAVDLMAARGSAVRTTMWALLRYVVVVLAFVLVWYLKLGNLISMFIGVMGLKASAYLQPFTHKFMKNLKKRDGGSPDKV